MLAGQRPFVRPAPRHLAMGRGRSGQAITRKSECTVFLKTQTLSVEMANIRAERPKEVEMTNLPLDRPTRHDRGTAPNRRRILMGAGSIAIGLTGVLTTQVSAQTSKPPAARGGVKSPAPAHPSVVDAAKRCGKVGDICLRHCVRLTRAGDNSIADCMRAVRAMLPVCSTMVALASQDAARLKDYAKVCADVCSDCEAECRKHEFHHVECKNCAEACAALVKECKSLMSA
jgi:Cys-rich four helix bundle protein (predicted Tat secretion target)